MRKLLALVHRADMLSAAPVLVVCPCLDTCHKTPAGDNDSVEPHSNAREVKGRLQPWHTHTSHAMSAAAACTCRARCSPDISSGSPCQKGSGRQAALSAGCAAADMLLACKAIAAAAAPAAV